MKVFTIGMDEKPPVKDNAVFSDGVTVTTTPIITLGKNRTSYKNYVMYMGTLIFILLFAIIISKLVLYKIPNDLGMPWFELKHQMKMGCDDCMIQPFYPQRSSRIFENSNHLTPSATLAMQAEQPQAIEQATSITSQASEAVDLSQPVDFHLDFLRKIIPKIKEQAEKSGVEGVMQVKVLQMDSFEPKKFLDKLDENQFRPVVNAPQPIEFMAPSRSTLLADLLRWKMGENDHKNGRNSPNLEKQEMNQIPENQFFESQQNDMTKSDSVLILRPFLQVQQLQLLPAAWDNNSNKVWSNSLHLLDLVQQISKQQQWNNFWQWPNPAYNKYNDEKVAPWQDIQWSKNQQYLATPVSQQMLPNPSIPWESSNYWQDNVQMGANWQNSIQNPWIQNGWQEYQYPQISISQNQYQNNNDWNIQRANNADNLDGQMSQAVLSSDNYYNHIYNNNANDDWMRYHRRLQQQPIANATVIQSLEVIRPELPYQVQNQNSRQQEQGQQQQQPQNDNQEQLQLRHRERPELPIYPIKDDLTGSSDGMKIIDNNLNRITENSEPVNDIGGFSNPTLFQVDEPSPQFSSMDESFAKFFKYQ